jgi:hypothetical protein
MLLPISEELVKQIRLMDYDRSKTLLEQSVIGAPIGGRIEDPKSAAKNLINLSIDDYVDIVSAIIGSVPGLGTLGSAIIDLLHAISYFIRVFTTNDFKEKTEYGILGLVQLFFAFDPTGAGGNVLMLAARGKIKKVFAMTPNETIFKLKELGFLKGYIHLGKLSLTWSWWVLLIKIVLNKALDEVINEISSIPSYLEKIYNEVEKYLSLTNKIVFDYVIYNILIPKINKIVSYLNKVDNESKKELSELSVTVEFDSWLDSHSKKDNWQIYSGTENGKNICDKYWDQKKYKREYKFNNLDKKTYCAVKYLGK